MELLNRPSVWKNETFFKFFSCRSRNNTHGTSGPAFGCWHGLEVGYVADNSEEHTASIMRAETMSVPVRITLRLTVHKSVRSVETYFCGSSPGFRLFWGILSDDRSCLFIVRSLDLCLCHLFVFSLCVQLYKHTKHTIYTNYTYAVGFLYMLQQSVVIEASYRRTLSRQNRFRLYLLSFLSIVCKS
jgi:hypothetical protein